MPSDLRERIVGLVDAAAPPIDVEALAAQLATRRDVAEAPRTPPVIPLRRRAWALAGAFTGALVLVGGALAAGMVLHEPAAPTPGEPGDAGAATGAASSGWWWIAIVVAVIGLGAATFMASRRRAKLPITIEEDTMQTLEKRIEGAHQPEVEQLTRQRRWLVITLAFVLVLGAVAIGWLITENRSLSSDLDAAIWPPESELTARQENMVDAVERFWSAWNAEDFDTLMSLYSPTAIHAGFSGNEHSVVDGELRTLMQSYRGVLGESEVLRTFIVGSFVSHVAETGSGQLDSYTYRFDTGDQPLIVHSQHDGSTVAGPFSG